MQHLIKYNEMNGNNSIDTFSKFYKKWLKTKYVSKNQQKILDEIGLRNFNELYQDLNNIYSKISKLDYDYINDVLQVEIDDELIGWDKRVWFELHITAYDERRSHREISSKIVISENNLNLPSSQHHHLTDKDITIDDVINSIYNAKNEKIIDYKRNIEGEKSNVWRKFTESELKRLLKSELSKITLTPVLCIEYFNQDRRYNFEEGTYASTYNKFSPLRDILQNEVIYRLGLDNSRVDLSNYSAGFVQFRIFIK